MSVSPASLSGADARGEAAMKKPKLVQGFVPHAQLTMLQGFRVLGLGISTFRVGC